MSERDNQNKRNPGQTQQKEDRESGQQNKNQKENRKYPCGRRAAGHLPRRAFPALSALRRVLTAAE